MIVINQLHPLLADTTIRRSLPCFQWTRAAVHVSLELSGGLEHTAYICALETLTSIEAAHISKNDNSL